MDEALSALARRASDGDPADWLRFANACVRSGQRDAYVEHARRVRRTRAAWYAMLDATEPDAERIAVATLARLASRHLPLVHGLLPRSHRAPRAMQLLAGSREGVGVLLGLVFRMQTPRRCRLEACRALAANLAALLPDLPLPTVFRDDAQERSHRFEDRAARARALIQLARTTRRLELLPWLVELGRHPDQHVALSSRALLEELAGRDRPPFDLALVLGTNPGV